MKRNRAAMVGTISGLLVLASGTVGFGLGRDGGRTTGAAGSDGHASAIGPAASTVAVGLEAPAATARSAAGMAVAPVPGPDLPGLPPFPAQAPEADGVHAVGVAYRKTDDPSAKPGQDLVRQAFEDAGRQARELADAAGVKLGKLVALSNVKQAQPLYNACVKPLAAPGDEARPAPGVPTTLPAPAPECSPTWYVVAWVFVRYELA